jgi:hypothetical protein
LTKVCNFVLTVGEKSARNTMVQLAAPILCTKMEKLLFGRCLKAGFNMVAREIKRGRKKTVVTSYVRTHSRGANCVVAVPTRSHNGPPPAPPLAAGG